MFGNLGQRLCASKKEPGFRFAVPSAQSPALDTLEERTFAVHATDLFPEEGSLIANAVAHHYDDVELDPYAPHFRTTLHFSLGGLAASHVARGSQQSWDRKKFALVLPLKSLENQLVNLSVHDSFVLGDFRIPEHAVLLVPEYFRHASKRYPFKIRTYDGSLRAAVDQVIKEQKGWLFSTTEGKTGLRGPALLKGRNINTPDFFARFLQSHPRVSFGSHSASIYGEGFRFGVIEGIVDYLLRPYLGLRHRKISMDEMKLLLQLGEWNLGKVQRYVNAHEWPQGSRKRFEEHLKKVQGWLNIVRADLRLMESRGISIRFEFFEHEGEIRMAQHELSQLEAVFSRIADAIETEVREIALKNPDYASRMQKFHEAPRSSELTHDNLGEMFAFLPEEEYRAFWDEPGRRESHSRRIRKIDNAYRRQRAALLRAR
ncbi:MAG: hypothetical protein AB1540_05210 [Bdellovibrionota bacterium]